MTETTVNPFDSSPILEGIRRWVEIETPTEAPEQSAPKIPEPSDFL